MKNVIQCLQKHKMISSKVFFCPNQHIYSIKHRVAMINHLVINHKFIINCELVKYHHFILH